MLKVREPNGESATFGPIRDLGSHHYWHERESRWGEIFTMRSHAGCQDVSQGCKELNVTILHVKLHAVGGNKTKTPGLGAQSAL